MPRFSGQEVQVAHPVEVPTDAKNLEIGVRPEFVTFGDSGIPVEIVKVSDAGRFRIVEARHDASAIKLLVSEGTELPAGAAHLRFDPAHTQIYADGWMVS